MRYYPTDKYGYEELEKLNADQWMVDALKMNPYYNAWGNHEDYMWNDDSQWASRIFLENVDELWQLDDLNELVNFYFLISRDSEACKHCDQSGYNEATKYISETFYDFNNVGQRWCNSITDDEVDTLWEAGRLNHKFVDKPTAEEVNRWNQIGMGHDAINRYILIEQRAKREGVYGLCEECNGEGYIYTEPKAKLQLQMWFLHPRKGSSRGVLLQQIKEDELQITIDYLKEARQRNWDRFSKLK